MGYVISVEKAKQTFVWPLEKIQNGKRKLVYMPKNFDVNDELAEFENSESQKSGSPEDPIYDSAASWISSYIHSWRHPPSDTPRTTLDFLS